ncbi:TIGR04222 domain-containing membrane protein [Streptomyces sp. NA04227]|uniref:TIGR04222 domain-containing membrane protein n=1 Tax=Streptomyces sp. NA04227 TaxID=2742136 RepID=UPI00159188BB|nr:TIGR04222 domain-containing membrane protein [Streptomyces sp. NA04227]QKW09902.1 TIGR04222 domain-containing membrane protein [Streptomyces sp. NA04227]
MGVLVLLVWLIVLGSAIGLTVSLNRARATAFVPGARPQDVLEAAFLAGGPGRVTDTALTAMCLDGRLAVAEPGIVAVHRAQAWHPVEQAVLNACASAPSGSLAWVRTTVMRGHEVQTVGDSLAQRGLLVRPEGLRPLRQWAILHTLVCVVAVPLSIVLTVFQYAGSGGSGFPVPFFIAVFPGLVLGIVLGVVSVVRSRGVLSVTGRRVLRSFAAGAAAGDALTRVAVGGPRTLPDPGLRAVFLSVARNSARRGGGTGGDLFLTPAFDVPVNWCGGGGTGCGGGGCGGSSCSGTSGSCGGSSGSSCGGSSGSSCGGGSSGGGGGCGGSS